MEPLNLMVTLNLVSDDVRREATGRATRRGTGQATGRSARDAHGRHRRSHALWSALRRSVTGHRPSTAS